LQDYTIDYVFYLDGTLEVKVRASGYIFAAFYATNTTKVDEYGHKVHDALSTSMHDHVINFKADLDVAGPTNDLVRMAIEPITKSYSWDLPDVTERNTMHLVEYPVIQETGMDWPKNGGEFYIVYSDKKNAWGERKGYRITSGTGMGATPHLTILNSTTLGDSARWAEHDLWVLQRKDTEPRGADPYNFLEPQDPIVDFTHLANGETLEHGEDYDGDLVIYFNVGAHHVPHSGDIPNTLMHTSATSVMFVPHNFNDRDPTRATSQGVRIQLNGKKNSGGFAGESLSASKGSGLGASDDLRARRENAKRAEEKEKRAEKKHVKPKAHYFGGTYDKGIKVPLEALEPSFEGYKTSEHAVTDLTFNGSVPFGTWRREGA
jgi:primary-amine oxidase